MRKQHVSHAKPKHLPPPSKGMKSPTLPVKAIAVKAPTEPEKGKVQKLEPEVRASKEVVTPKTKKATPKAKPKRVMSEETKQKISAKMKQNALDKKQAAEKKAAQKKAKKAVWVEPKAGKKAKQIPVKGEKKASPVPKKRVMSEETKKKISESKKRFHATDKKGKRAVSEASRKKMSEAQKGHVVSEATKQKLSQIRKGKPMDEATRKKISATIQAKKREALALKPSKEIEIQGLKVLIDAEDETLVRGKSWSTPGGGHRLIGGYNYKGKHITCTLARYILAHHQNLTPGMVVGYLNKNTLDNRKCNLVVSTKSPKAKKVRGSMRKGWPKGVYQRGNSFEVILRVDGKLEYFGRFKTMEKAAAEAAKH